MRCSGSSATTQLCHQHTQGACITLLHSDTQGHACDSANEHQCARLLYNKPQQFCICAAHQQRMLSAEKDPKQSCTMGVCCQLTYLMKSKMLTLVCCSGQARLTLTTIPGKALQTQHQLLMSMTEHCASLDRRTSTCCTWQSLTVLSHKAKE